MYSQGLAPFGRDSIRDKLMPSSSNTSRARLSAPRARIGEREGERRFVRPGLLSILAGDHHESRRILWPVLNALAHHTQSAELGGEATSNGCSVLVGQGFARG